MGATCMNKAAGHKDEATTGKMMGSNNRIIDRTRPNLRRPTNNA
jgi:hypothetical protein